jgi:hypothetical protein
LDDKVILNLEEVGVHMVGYLIYFDLKVIDVLMQANFDDFFHIGELKS